jgi:hypothetical protein
MCLPQCRRPKEDIICKSIRKGINARGLYNDGYSDSFTTLTALINQEFKFISYPEIMMIVEVYD